MDNDYLKNSLAYVKRLSALEDERDWQELAEIVGIDEAVFLYNCHIGKLTEQDKQQAEEFFGRFDYVQLEGNCIKKIPISLRKTCNLRFS